MLNHRQAYKELEEQNKQLSRDYLELQRLLKRCILDGCQLTDGRLHLPKQSIYTNTRLDCMKLNIQEVDSNNIEINIIK